MFVPENTAAMIATDNKYLGVSFGRAIFEQYVYLALLFRLDPTILHSRGLVNLEN
jgi:hypothetical protein